MSIRYHLATGLEDHFRIIAGARGGGPLWSGDSSKPRASYLLWRAPDGEWRAYVGGCQAANPMSEVARGRTRDTAFANALLAAKAAKNKKKGL